MKVAGIILMFLCAQSANAACSYAVLKQSFQPRVIDGQAFLVVAENQVDKQCIDIELIVAEIGKNEELKKTLTEYKALNDSMADKVARYEKLVEDYDKTATASVEMTNLYDSQLGKYEELTGNYDELVSRYDVLAGKYRDISLSSSSPISIDLGIGTSQDGNFTGLIGVGISRLKAWGVYQNGDSALLVGTSFMF
jgi:hypothetical protein